MVYPEYYDLFLIAQKNPNALYYVISFEVKKSRLLSSDKRHRLTKNLDIIAKDVYNRLLQKEKELGIQIVIKDKRFYKPWDYNKNNSNFMDPSIFGDNIIFTVLRNTITKEEIIDWVIEDKERLNMEENINIADGYYETNEYEEGSTKLYRGYCLETVANLHKPKVQKELKKLIKTLGNNKNYFF